MADTEMRHITGAWYFGCLTLILSDVVAAFSIYYFEEGQMSPWTITWTLSVLVIVCIVMVLKIRPIARNWHAHLLVFGLLFASLLVIATVFSSYYYSWGLYDTIQHTVLHEKFDALYFSIGTMVTSSYGDLIPFDEKTRALAVFEGALGYILLAAVVAMFVAIFERDRV